MADPFTPDLESGLGVVRAVAVRLSARRRCHADCTDDFISDGNVALVHALRSYDPQHGLSWGSYIRCKSRHAMIDGLRERTKYRARKAHGIPFTDLSLDEVVRCGGEGHISTAAKIAVPPEEPRFGSAWRMLDRLNPRHAYVLRRRYEGDARFIEIADELGVCESRVCEMHASGLRALRKALNVPTMQVIKR